MGDSVGNSPIRAMPSAMIRTLVLPALQLGLLPQSAHGQPRRFVIGCSFVICCIDSCISTHIYFMIPPRRHAVNLVVGGGSNQTPPDPADGGACLHALSWSRDASHAPRFPIRCAPTHCRWSLPTENHPVRGLLACPCTHHSEMGAHA